MLDSRIHLVMQFVPDHNLITHVFGSRSLWIRGESHILIQHILPILFWDSILDGTHMYVVVYSKSLKMVYVWFYDPYIIWDENIYAHLYGLMHMIILSFYTCKT